MHEARVHIRSLNRLLIDLVQSYDNLICLDQHTNFNHSNYWILGISDLIKTKDNFNQHCNYLMIKLIFDTNNEIMSDTYYNFIYSWSIKSTDNVLNCIHFRFRILELLWTQMTIYSRKNLGKNGNRLWKFFLYLKSATSRNNGKLL